LLHLESSVVLGFAAVSFFEFATASLLAHPLGTEQNASDSDLNHLLDFNLANMLSSFGCGCKKLTARILGKENHLENVT